MKLYFSESQQLSIYFFVQALIKADGLIRPEENVCWNTVSIKMNWPEANAELIDNYDENLAMQVLKEMNDDQKHFATAFFTMIILADQQVAPEEDALLHDITMKAELPVIPSQDCANVLEQYLK